MDDVKMCQLVLQMEMNRRVLDLKETDFERHGRGGKETDSLKEFSFP